MLSSPQKSKQCELQQHWLHVRGQPTSLSLLADWGPVLLGNNMFLFVLLKQNKTKQNMLQLWWQAWSQVDSAFPWSQLANYISWAGSRAASLGQLSPLTTFPCSLKSLLTIHSLIFLHSPYTPLKSLKNNLQIAVIHGPFHNMTLADSIKRKSKAGDVHSSVAEQMLSLEWDLCFNLQHNLKQKNKLWKSVFLPP